MKAFCCTKNKLNNLSVACSAAADTSAIQMEECQAYGLVTAVAGTRTEREEELTNDSEDDNAYEVVNL